jgi:triosephosphate isomerase
MNGLVGQAAEISGLINALRARPPRCAVAVCPPATLLAIFESLVRGTPVLLGGQDCHSEPAGAYTGDISAPMLRDAGASYVILGHSERRELHGESSALVAAKVGAAGRAGLTAILCVGETQRERDSGAAEAVVDRQLKGSIPVEADASRLVIAYEPVWAIGTGRVPMAADITAMHALMRRVLDERLGPAADGVAVLYGGSVKPDNAREILALPNVDGALVGGASLKAADFLKIIWAA